MKANPDKCHLLLNNSCKKKVNMGKFHIESSTQEKFLRIKIDNNFNFASYVENLCKCQPKNPCFSQNISLHEFNKATITIKCIFVSQFSYCALAWMYHSRTLNNRINKSHEKCCCVTYNDKKTTFQKLLDKDYNYKYNYNYSCYYYYN